MQLFLSYKNSNSWNMTVQGMKLLSKNNQWTIPLSSHISLCATVLVRLHMYYNEENKLFKEEN